MVSQVSYRSMYHMVRFFDRKKILRRLQRAEKVKHVVEHVPQENDCLLKEQSAAMENGNKKAIHKADKVALHILFLK